MVNDVRPDILALCECEGFLEGDGQRRDAFCNAVGMDGSFVRAPSGNHVGLLHREPWLPDLTRTVSVPMYHGLVRVSLAGADGFPIDVVATHLNPYSSVFRLAEAQVVLSRIQPRGNAIVLGDMNSLPVGTPAVGAQRLLDLQLQPDTEVAHYFAAAGLIDLIAQHKDATPSYPTSLEEKADDFGAGVRLDYVYGTRSMARLCTRAYVVDSPQAQLASDHLPVVAEFEIP
jgi:exodeoxyribonuclease-3